MIPLPLLEVNDPDIVNDSPAAGLARTGSIVRFVGDLTVMVVIIDVIECSVEDPLKNKDTATKPRG